MSLLRAVASAACAVTVVGSIMACSSPSAPSGAGTGDSTQANTLAAMHGEAFAHAKYLAYAGQAQQAGNAQAAQAFTDAAAVELSDHFAKEADLISFGGDNAANLRDAIDGETGEATKMYPDFAAQAAAKGDVAASRLFTEIAADEAAHAKDFTAALAAVSAGAATTSIPTGPTTNPVTIAAGGAQASASTVANLRTAMTGEAFAYAKYMRYADLARQSGNPGLADLFTRTANVELQEHYAAEAVQAGLVSTETRANLTDAATGEQHEADSMYPDYARQADEAAKPQAAKLFREIAGDEKAHQQLFTTASTTP